MTMQTFMLMLLLMMILMVIIMIILKEFWNAVRELHFNQAYSFTFQFYKKSEMRIIFQNLPTKHTLAVSFVISGITILGRII